MTTHVRVHLETLLVDRSVATEAGGIARSVELELARLLDRRLPARLTRPGHTLRLAAPLRGASPVAVELGARVAGAVYDALDAPGPRPSPSSTRSPR